MDSQSASPSRPNPLSILKWAAIGLLALIAVALAAALVFLKSIDPKPYVADAARVVKEKTGRDLVVAGTVDLRVSLAPEIVLENVGFANAPWGSRKEMLRLRRLELEIALLPLLRGDVKVSRLVLVEPDVLLEVDEKGRGNWELGQPPAAAEPAPTGSGAPPIRIGSLHVEKAKLAYLDRRSKKRTELVLVRLDAKPRHLLASGYDVDIAGALNGQGFTITGAVGDPRDALADRALFVDLVAKLPGLEAKVDGEVARPRSLTGFDAKLDLNVSDARAAGAFAGAPVPSLPPLRVIARVRDSGSGQTLEPLQVTLGKSQLAGSLRVERKSPRPKVTARLAGPLVDFSEVAPRKPQAKSESREGRVFSSDPLPFATLKSFDLDAELKIDKLVLPGGDRAEALQLKAALDDGRLKVAPAKFSAAGGGINATLDLDATSGKSAALNLRADGSGLALGTLLAMAGHPQQMSGGRTDLKLEATGAGNSMRALMGSLNGYARATVGEAQIAGRGLDLGAGILDQAADVLNPGRGSTQQLTCAVVNVPVRNGVITLDHRVALETTKVAMTGEGTVNLGTEALDVAVRSKGKGGVGLADFAGAARVGGTLANPRIGVDARGAAEAAATVGSAVATGGLSLLSQSLFSKAFPDHPCQDALAARAPAAPARGGQPPQDKKKEPGFFERIFGK
ncbi:MAG TPA: AsmA family protein [Burkholderiales bacterium]|nr:AsmA family protein [Burkholderiales bacterium]